MNNQPIGIMDSGIGGLTVARELHRKYPNENIIFIGDNARNPYGERTAKEIISFAEELKRFLLSQNVKMILVACNTISFTVPQAFYEDRVPIIPMSLDLPNLDGVGEIAVFATPATIARHIHKKQIESLEPNIKIDEVPCAGLAHAIEMNASDAEKKKLLHDAVKMYHAGNASVGWLACTHYPLITSVFDESLPNCRFYDPAEPTVKKGMDLLKDKDSLAEKGGSCSFCFTGSIEFSEPLCHRFFGENAAVKKIELPGV
jgi:glutamate racemase